MNNHICPICSRDVPILYEIECEWGPEEEPHRYKNIMCQICRQTVKFLANRYRILNVIRGDVNWEEGNIPSE